MIVSPQIATSSDGAAIPATVGVMGVSIEQSSRDRAGALLSSNRHLAKRACGL
jgi:hypothetical protein